MNSQLSVASRSKSSFNAAPPWHLHAGPQDSVRTTEAEFHRQNDLQFSPQNAARRVVAPVAETILWPHQRIPNSFTCWNISKCRIVVKLKFGQKGDIPNGIQMASHWSAPFCHGNPSWISAKQPPESCRMPGEEQSEKYHHDLWEEVETKRIMWFMWFSDSVWCYIFSEKKKHQPIIQFNPIHLTCLKKVKKNLTSSPVKKKHFKHSALKFCFVREKSLHLLWCHRITCTKKHQPILGSTPLRSTNFGLDPSRTLEVPLTSASTWFKRFTCRFGANVDVDFFSLFSTNPPF